MNNIGRIIKGYCNGFCGDSYNDKIIIFETKKAIVYKYIEGYYDGIGVANFDSEEEKNQYIEKWENDVE